MSFQKILSVFCLLSAAVLSISTVCLHTSHAGQPSIWSEEDEFLSRINTLCERNWDELERPFALSSPEIMALRTADAAIKKFFCTGYDTANDARILGYWARSEEINHARMIVSGEIKHPDFVRSFDEFYQSTQEELAREHLAFEHLCSETFFQNLQNYLTF